MNRMKKIVESLHSFTFRPILFNQNLTKCAVEAFETYFVIRNFLLKYPLSLSTLLD